jgi:NADH-quinone oxidoreductase subunit E
MSEQFEAVFTRHSPQRDDLIPILQDIQDACGYISPEAMKATAEFLNVTETSVYGVATFYAQFHLSPQGRHSIKVCQGTACHVRGGKKIAEAIQQELGIGPGETTDDFEFSVERVACFGSCALAPVVVVDGEVYGRMTAEKALRLLEDLE